MRNAYSAIRNVNLEYQYGIVVSVIGETLDLADEMLDFGNQNEVAAAQVFATEMNEDADDNVVAEENADLEDFAADLEDLAADLEHPDADLEDRDEFPNTDASDHSHDGFLSTWDKAYVTVNCLDLTVNFDGNDIDDDDLVAIQTARILLTAAMDTEAEAMMKIQIEVSEKLISQIEEGLKRLPRTKQVFS